MFTDLISLLHIKNLFWEKFIGTVNIPALKKLDKLIMVGNETIAEAEKIGISKENVYFIPNGFYPDEIQKNCTRERSGKNFRMDLSDKKVDFSRRQIYKTQRCGMVHTECDAKLAGKLYSCCSWSRYSQKDCR